MAGSDGVPTGDRLIRGAAVQNDNPNVRPIRVLDKHEYTLGVPTTVFISSCLVAAALIFAVNWLGGLVFSGILFGFLFHVHRDDPRGIEAWTRGGLKARWRYCGARYRRRPVVFIKSR